MAALLGIAVFFVVVSTDSVRLRHVEVGLVEYNGYVAGYSLGGEGVIVLLPFK